MSFRIISRFAAFALLSAGLVGAQGPGSPPSAADRVANQVAHLTSLLSLTSAQQAQATTIFTDQQTATASVITAMKTARTALETAVESNDAATITAQATQIGSLTTQEVESRAKADAAFYAILTADQQTKYKQVGHGGPGGGGPGGPRGPHPGMPPQD